MNWLCLFVAGLLEVVWAVGLKYTEGFTRPAPSAVTVGAMIGSFYLLSVALRSLPLGTAYAVWGGIGAVGTVLVGILFFSEPTTLDWLSERSGFTPQHLNRVFRGLLGVTPLQYLNRMRMERAASLLADGRLTIKAIAREVSFDDPYYFSRQFKQHFGRSPAQYRDALQA